MTNSRDRDKNRAGDEPRPREITDAEILEKIEESCRLMHRQNLLLLEQLRVQRRSILATIKADRLQ